MFHMPCTQKESSLVQLSVEANHCLAYEPPSPSAAVSKVYIDEQMAK